MPICFITSCGTGRGKTYVSEKLISDWRVAGETVDVLKPVISGFEMKAAADSTGFELNATSQQFIETMNVTSLPEPSIMANPVGVVIGLIALVIILVPLWANQNNT